MRLDMILDYTVWTNAEAVQIETARLDIPAPENDPQVRHGLQIPPFDGASAPTANLPFAIQTAKRRKLTTRELSQSFGAYTGQDRVWLIPAVLVPAGVALKPADVVIDGDGNRWTALEAERGADESLWRLTTRNLVLALDLRELITIERPATSYDAAGAVVKAWPSGPQPRGGEILYGQLPARVQLLTKEIKEERGIRGLEKHYDVIVGRQVSVAYEDRVFWRGQYLDIVGYRNAERIDELPVIDARGKV